MNPLPVPPLAQSLERFITSVSPLLTDEEIEQTKAAALDFENNCGPALQQRLLAFAQQEDEKGLNWLTDIKLDGYLKDPSPLALCSNPGLQLEYPATDTGIKRVASLIHRVARTHIDYINGDIEQPVDARGQPISMYNWRVLFGAMREPKTGGDAYYYAEPHTANRHVSVMWQGHHFALQVSNDKGEVYAVPTLVDALQRIIDGDYQPPELDFMSMSALGSEKTGAYIEALCAEPHNQQVYQALRDGLFCIYLYHSGKPALQQLHKQTFMPGHAWQYKPFSYQLDLDSDFVGMHFEHSEMDGGALKLIYTYAFTLELDDSTTGQPTITQLDWIIDPATSANIQKDVDALAERAKHYQLDYCSIDFSAITTRVSHDAILQFALIYAQLKVFGKARQTYEAVDTSHFKAGRTEAMRPVSGEAIALCQALLDDQASKELLNAAFAVHKARVIACKTGQAFDRHLSGLQEMIEPNDDQACLDGFFSSPGYKTQTGGDFLSTTSMGNRFPIMRVVFVPTRAAGFGVYYSYDGTEYEFLFIGDQQSSHYLTQLRDAAIEGVNKLIQLFISD